jgi:hypothetical protein
VNQKPSQDGVYPLLAFQSPGMRATVSRRMKSFLHMWNIFHQPPSVEANPFPLNTTYIQCLYARGQRYQQAIQQPMIHSGYLIK